MDRPRLLPDPAEMLRQRLVGQVRAVFNDQAAGESPVANSDAALFARDTPIRRVHADIVAMMVGGIRSLLLQMLHPHALQGVLDHSNFREDMQGRLRRTARFIAVTTFAHRDEAQAAIARVNRIHEQVRGTLPDGTPYSARDPRTLAFVHLAEAESFLLAYRRFVQPAMSQGDQDAYFRQFAEIARALGADPVPETRREAEALMREMRGQLRGSAEAREIARLVVQHSAATGAEAVQHILGTAAIDLLPPFARAQLGLAPPGITALPARLATGAMAGTLRWAFRQN